MRSVQYLRDYVAIPSVNPMGRSDVPPEIAGERRYAEHLREQLRRLGLDAELLGSASRASVVAEAHPRAPGAPLLVASHLDTVPVDGMEIDPFDPVIDAGRLYGRGACDTKGGMAALLAALERVLARGRLRRSVIVVGEADEECGSVGVTDVLGHLGRRAGRAVDWVLATEPTELRVVTRHKGIALLRLEARGLACHSSDPTRGRSAIAAIARAALALEALGAELAERVGPAREPAGHEPGPADPKLGPATLSVGLIGGGHAPNIVPDRAWLLAERRMLPGETDAQLRAEVEEVLTRRGVEDVDVVRCETMKPALGTDSAHASVRACCAALLAAGRLAEPAAVAFGTDAGVFAAHGIPGVVMGPGSIAQAHTAREFVALEQVEAMEELFVRLLETPS
jgi:acetylornithine deacetylase/succinyl-diaminopimelate desuccinylase-like protein